MLRKIHKRNSFRLALAGILSASIFLTSYTDNQIVSTDSSDTLKQGFRPGAFVEKGFPYIPTSIDGRKLGLEFPDDNVAARTLALELGDSAYACFDTDLLRWSVAWTGKFLPMVLMAQISYDDFFNKNNKLAYVPGVPQFATGSYAGWYVGGKIEKHAYWTPLEAAKGRWKGSYVFENKAILNYTVGEAEIFELPGAGTFSGQTAFSRTFNIEKQPSDLKLIVAEVRNAKKIEVKDQVAYIYQGANSDTVTAVSLAGKNKFSWKTEINDNKYLTVHVPAHEGPVQASVVIWKGPAKMKKAFEKYARSLDLTLPDFEKGGSDKWKETVVTKGTLSPDTAAFVTDILTLPLGNPWKRNVRVADIAFTKTGRGVVVTFEGDVWTIDRIDKDLGSLKWKRFASGLFEPMSIEVVDEKIYVFGREGIVRLNDLNNDGMADFYENFSNIMPQSSESREWAADMVPAPGGGFYIAKGGTLDNGPGLTDKSGKGFRKGAAYNGSVLKISPDGLRYEVIATGLRGPYLGINPENGTLTASDQQGNFVPSTPIFLIRKGDYYGVEPTKHRDDNPPITPPLTWIPHAVDRSSISQAWITGNKMGPLNGNLIHFSFGRPGLFRVVIDSSAKIIQGGVSVINANYPAPTSKGSVEPLDGQLYVAGFNLWGSGSTGISALLRLRYTGKPSYMPNQLQETKEGVVLGFDSELDEKAATNIANYQVQRWNYKRTEEYGSGYFKLDGSKGQETMAVVGAYLSADKKKIVLLIPDMKEVMQMELSYNIVAKDGKRMSDQFWFTVNNMSDLKPATYGIEKVDLALLTNYKTKKPEAASAEPVTVERGRGLFQKMACVGCHSPGTKTDGMYGPPFKNMYGSERHFEDGTSVVADDKYVVESILSPSKKVVKGYSAEMPSFEGILTDSDIQSIAMYIKSLSGK